ncbi:hypothetical protein E1287_07185 [Actinomadura sp. KC06]|uniref:hypothetical protein n=1 Tax=Actinomadura sp. KC06 TaxID=2530369 RepID=UPI001051CA22|nr:hypothetical protein [Actinomadura sp. KC06]TDD37835.1 hypothetical protein E1287_07185 [Actinomadura sp. KC06]
MNELHGGEAPVPGARVEAIREGLAVALETAIPGPWVDRAATVLAPIVTGLRTGPVTAVPDDLPKRDGTGAPFATIVARTEQHLQRSIDAGCSTWADLVRARLYAALAETDPERLHAAVLNLGSTCEAWAGDLARRQGL